MHPAQRYMPRSPRVGCLSKRDALDAAHALLAKAAGDEAGLRALADRDDVPDHVGDVIAQLPSPGGATPIAPARLS
jgi:hypothetical protein